MTVILPNNPPHSEKLKSFLAPLLPEGSGFLDPSQGLNGLRGRKLLFAVALDGGGCSLAYYRMLSTLRKGGDLLSGCTAGVIVMGQGELYTKDVARDLVLAANLSGCAFLGRPLVEATGSLRNFRVQAQIYDTDEPTAFRMAAEELTGRLQDWEGPPPVRRVLALHASMRATSNTLALWELVKAGLPDSVAVQELCLQNGTLADCIGCSYTACLHFGQQGGCFYGGPMVDEVFPAVRECDALVMLCANYNDALAANLTAFVNRLTALFRQSRFYEKRLYGLIVSGYSGGDLIARQLISGLNMNKSFYLPPRFCMMETANEKGSLVRLPGVAERSREFAARMMDECTTFL
ncbi:MAG: NAD(P)H-dependent oxidoreductase [Oscillospiraceae bacterium]|nr:NAD(P)H-dependent oxidoreductase [Oscillospiraceae bacterium]